MNVGDKVAVFDSRARRWCAAHVISRYLARITVSTDSWWAIVPCTSEFVRAIRVVS